MGKPSDNKLDTGYLGRAWDGQSGVVCLTHHHPIWVSNNTVLTGSTCSTIPESCNSVGIQRRIVEPHSPRSQQLLLIVHIHALRTTLSSVHAPHTTSTEYMEYNTRSTTCRDHQQLSTSSTLLIRVIWGFALQPPGYFAQSALAAVCSSLSS